MSIIEFENHFVNIIKDVFKREYCFTENLDQLHRLLETDKITKEELTYQSKTKILGKNDRQSIFVKKFHNYIDNNTREPTTNETFVETYHKFIKKYITPIYPEEEESLVIQKTPNIRFSFPNNVAIGANIMDPEGIVGLHKDADFGHHFTEQNFVIPMTDMFDTNSFFYNADTKYMNKPIEEYTNLSIKQHQFFTGYLNQWKHYNKENKTGKTRISFDARIIPYSVYEKYEDYFVGTKFELEKGYYTLLENK